MSSTTTGPIAVPSGARFPAILRLVPGVLLLAVIGYLGKLTEQGIAQYGKAHHLHLPNIEYVLWAIIYGLVVSNTIGIPTVFKPGVATYEFWVKLGIVFLGVRFLLGDVWKLGGMSLAFVALELGMSILLMTLLGKWLNLSPKLTSLLAIGSSICGVSAIIAAKGAIDADDEDVSYAIAAILALGAFSLFAFPLIGHSLGMSDHAFGLWAGLAVDNTAEAYGCGRSLFRRRRQICRPCQNRAQRDHRFRGARLRHLLGRKSKGEVVRNKLAFLWQKFPKFVLGFLLISLAATVGLFSKPQITDIANLSRWAFLLTFAGVGLQTNIRQLRKQGLKPLLVGAIGEFAIAGLTLVLITGASRFFTL